jgi:DNA-binding response OmpR family regulator
MKILIIEDEYNLADAIATTLKYNNYLVEIYADGLKGYEEALTEIYDLIILDVMLPNKNGFEILKDLRKEMINSKIIMLTAKSEIEDKMIGFNNGADDYLTKPFHIDELIARINKELRRKDYLSKDFLTFNDIKLNLKDMKLYNNNNNLNIKIIGKEFSILELLMNNPNQIIKKEQIFIKIWGYNSDCDINILEAYISFLRKKLKLIKANTTIKAIRNMGYVLEVNNEKTKN